MKKRHLLVWALLPLLSACNPAHRVPAANDRAATPTAHGTLALMKLQRRSGAFAGPNNSDHAGITALAGLALLSATDVAPSTTSYQIDHAADFLLASQNSDGYICHEGDSAGMYGHAFATLFLTQLYASTTSPVHKAQISDAINKAIHLIESAQNSQGGWRYTPTPADADVSVTAAQVKALVAAKQQRFKVADATLSRAVSYLKSAQQPDGGFAYTLSTSGSSGWPRSAAATAALLYAGAGADQDTSKALAYLKQNDSKDVNFFYYGNYYFSQSLNLGDPDKTKSMSALRSALLARQNPATGLWSGEAGDPYATSMALIILYMPDTRLPAFK